MLASVIVQYSVKSLDKTFDYNVPSFIMDKLKIGHKVLVPFGKTKVEGFVLNIHNNIDNNIDNNIEYKDILEIVDEEFYLNEELIKLGKYLSDTLLCNLISSYQVMLPRALKAQKNFKVNKKYESYVILKDNDVDKYIENNKRNTKEIEILKLLKENNKVLKKEISGPSLNKLIEKNMIVVENIEVNRDVSFIKEDNKDVVLTYDQKKAYDEIINSSDSTYLLHGITGSGKTEVYIQIMKYYLSTGKSVLFLVPEISLTPQIISRFKNAFKTNIAILHSALSQGQKYDEYRKIMKQEVKVVIGARSAVFAPLQNIGVIIIDECSSASYKQENNPKYNAIDIAIKRSEYNNSKCILGSATPSLEQYARALKNVYKLVTLDKRINDSIPSVEIVDMTKEAEKRNYILSDILISKINDRLSKNEQVILLLNRRGYSTFVTCSYCGYTYKCPSCDITLTYHKTTGNLRCHYCGYTKQYNNICPACKEMSLKDLGLGTEKLESLIKEKFKNAKVMRMDTDTTSVKESYSKLINSFKNREYDILVGTQMISKGLNFPYVTLVGVINADTSLLIPDFRSGEKTFELLMQTSGRSGRNDKKGEVLIQTYNKDHYVFNYVKKNDFIGFYNEEMSIRRLLKYPPYVYLCYIKVVSQDFNLAKQNAVNIKKYLDSNLGNEFVILGPSTARIFKINNKYNFGIIIKYKKENNLYYVLNEIKNNMISSKVNVDIDFNPLNTL